ncbi:MAG: adenosylcobinamide-phosphate synthase CbiB [Chloroflexota bacterium]|nr:adenosylcobinamide-phosphate synthase CbiB [Chloroflexota bacterium]MDE2920832.1 adenosylcobinamide-phosphate synthase CbiB [Chloroflexota bacterium]
MPSAFWEVLLWDAAILVLAFVLDRVLPEPPNVIHPVVWMGRATAVLARLDPQRPFASFLYGGCMVVLVVGVAGSMSWFGMSVLSSIHPTVYVIGGALVLRSAFAVTGLSAAAQHTRRHLQAHRLDAARDSLRNLVSRDARSLGKPLVAAAAIESVAENSTDSFVGPWLAFAVFGVPGAIAYRAINTMDSMIGYRDRYEYLGKVAARLDDLVNLIPARVSAGLLLLCGRLAGCPLRDGWRTMLRDRGKTASPNAGLTMSAMAGLLGVRLEKPGHYSLGAEFRNPGSHDIGRAVAMVNRTSVLALTVSLGLLVARHAISG